jgi:hypothetical protein
MATLGRKGATSIFSSISLLLKGKNVVCHCRNGQDGNFACCVFRNTIGPVPFRCDNGRHTIFPMIPAASVQSPVLLGIEAE